MMKFSIERIIRKNILALESYSCAREEYSGRDIILLDANENPYDTAYNRYPDPFQYKLKERLAAIKGVRIEQLILGNGSDELIDMLIRITCEPKRDNVILFSPGYSMYEICARINGVEVRKLNMDSQMMPVWEEIPDHIDDSSRLIFFCSPNNPVGNLLPLERIVEFARNFNGLLVVDEAYIDFSDGESALSKIDDNPNIVVLQTLSKAWGLAGLRVGIGIADPRLIFYLNKIKPPYNIGEITQRASLRALGDTGRFIREVDEIKRERERLYRELSKMEFIEQLYPSQANFILITTAIYEKLYRYLIRGGIVVRIRHLPPLINGGLRITVGRPEENDRLITLLKNWNGE